MAISSFNRKKQFFAPYVEGLIKQLTDFEEDDRNFQEVARFIYTNIIHHNFATVDINKVQQSVQSIAEKLKAHGLSQRGERFLELVNKYVSSDSSHHSQLNVQWHVLLLLLKLSYSPTRVSEEELKIVAEESVPSEPEENINWPEYLREGWEEFQCPSEHSDDEDDDLWLTVSENEDEEEVESECGHKASGDKDLQGYNGIPHPVLWSRGPPPLTRAEVLRRVIREGVQAEQWLRQHVQHSWWCDRFYKCAVDSKHPAAHMYEVWEKCMVSKCKIDSIEPIQSQVLSEAKVLHEVLWLLQVSTETSLFYLDTKGDCNVRSNTSLASTIPDTLHAVLKDLCFYINMTIRLRRFQKTLKDQEVSEVPPPVTFKGYCAALFEQLSKFTDLVISIETRLHKQEETMTLLSVMEELGPMLVILHYLYSVHVRAVNEPDDDSSAETVEPAWLRATRLLSVLYQALQVTSDDRCLEACLQVFLQTFRVYLDIIDVWLSEGRLEDWRQEFLVIKDETGKLCVQPYEAEMRKCNVQPVSLLSKLVALVREAGDTMQIVSRLNKLSQLRDTVQNRGHLYREFVENVYNEIKRLKETLNESKEEITQLSIAGDVNEEMYQLTLPSVVNSVTVSLVVSDTSINGEEVPGNNSPTSDCSSPRQCNDSSNEKVVVEEEAVSKEIPAYLSVLTNKEMYERTTACLLHNPLLREAFSCYMDSAEPSRSSSPSQCYSQLSGSLVGLISLHSVLEKQLELVATRQKIASRLVTHTLRSEHSLMQHFTVLRTVFFMESGNLAQSFYSFLFKEIEAGTLNPLSLSCHLRMCVDEFHPGFGHYFSVLVKRGTITYDVHEAIPSISLSYAVDWPVDIIITGDTIYTYNQVFRFLLHIKYAYWTLHGLHFSDLSESKDEIKVKRLYSLRMWMYHTTNIFHSFFMGLVLGGFYTHLKEIILMAESIQAITQAHEKFLEEVKVHSLQNRKNVEKVILKLLRMCSKLSDQWQMEAVGGLSEEEQSDLEEEFENTFNALVHCLESVTADADSNHFLYALKEEIRGSEPESCPTKQ